MCSFSEVYAGVYKYESEDDYGPVDGATLLAMISVIPVAIVIFMIISHFLSPNDGSGNLTFWFTIVVAFILGKKIIYAGIVCTIIIAVVHKLLSYSEEKDHHK